MAYKDLRWHMAEAEADGELVRLSGAGPDLEMNSLAEMAVHRGKGTMPLLLFSNIPGYDKGIQTLYGLLASPRRIARALYVPLPEERNSYLPLVPPWRVKSKDLKFIPPKVLKSGPILENVLSGDKVDLSKFPAIRAHEQDGGKYIGTGCAVILKDPNSDWVNLGTYRCMVVDDKRITTHILEDRHGRSIAYDGYLDKGKVMPIAVAIGMDPTIWFASIQHAIPWGVSEYAYAGGIQGSPVEVVKGPYTGLPIPAHAELVIEGEVHPGELVNEGPFGEWHGYYGNLGLESVPELVVRVKSILYRNNPILTCAHPCVPPSDHTYVGCVKVAATIWERLEKSGIPGIKGVWPHGEGGGILFNVVSIKQMYAGHSTEVGMIASQHVSTGGRYTIVVDDDIDPSDISQVLWALSTRSDPQRSIQIIHHCDTTSADTVVPPAEKRKWKVAPKPLYNTRAVIDACQPFEWRHEWYPVARVSPALKESLTKKWKKILGDTI